MRVRLRQRLSKAWARIYAQSKARYITFRQLRGLFIGQQGCYPPQGTPFTPKEDLDWFRYTVDVPAERLHSPQLEKASGKESEGRAGSP